MSDDATVSHDEELTVINKIISSTRFASFTTRTTEGDLVSRPLAVLKHDFDGSVWFFTQDPSPKTADLQHDSHVNVSYVHGATVLSLAGHASVTRDPARIDEFWNKAIEAWFEKGRDDDTVALVKVNATSAEYWDVDKPAIARALEVVKALATGSTPDVGTSRTVEL